MNNDKKLASVSMQDAPIQQFNLLDGTDILISLPNGTTALVEVEELMEFVLSSAKQIILWDALVH